MKLTRNSEFAVQSSAITETLHCTNFKLDERMQWAVSVTLNQGRESDVVEDFPQRPDKPSIAVLAFENMSGDPEQMYFFGWDQRRHHHVPRRGTKWPTFTPPPMAGFSAAVYSAI